jgi:hypothetical protein
MVCECFLAANLVKNILAWSCDRSASTLVNRTPN